MSNTENTVSEVPCNLKAWLASLPEREGWSGWSEAGHSVYEGVQNWAHDGTVGVWGSVVEGEAIDSECPDFIEWCVYVGDSVDPHKKGFETAEDAMWRAEQDFPEAFKLAKKVL